MRFTVFSNIISVPFKVSAGYLLKTSLTMIQTCQQGIQTNILTFGFYIVKELELMQGKTLGLRSNTLQ